MGVILEINSVKCLKCGKTLTSTSRHDFQMCSCPNKTFCDGGHDYQRIGGVNMKKIAVFDNESKKYIKWQKHMETTND
jgi:CDGSH-type Zn-finger protein